MKKKIIIGSLLAVFLITMLPTTNVVGSNTVKETLKSQLPHAIPNIDFERIKLKNTDNPAEPLVITTLLIWLLKIIRGILSASIVFLKIVRGIMLVVKAYILSKIVGNTTGLVN